MKTVSKERQIQLDKALAYFMGWRIDNSFPDKDKVWRKGNAVELETTFKFSSDWNWIMEVYNAINNLEGYSVSISGGYCSVFMFGLCDFSPNNDNASISIQESVYRCLGEFIESYNAKQLNGGK